MEGGSKKIDSLGPAVSHRHNIEMTDATDDTTKFTPFERGLQRFLVTPDKRPACAWHRLRRTTNFCYTDIRDTSLTGNGIPERLRTFQSKQGGTGARSGTGLKLTNTGVGCRANNLCVIDLDTDKWDTVDGRLQHPFADEFGLPGREDQDAEVWDTYCVETGKGGYHLYYRQEVQKDAVHSWDGVQSSGRQPSHAFITAGAPGDITTRLITRRDRVSAGLLASFKKQI